MSPSLTMQQIRESDDKFAMYWLIGVFVGGPVLGLLFALCVIWLFKYVANSAGYNFRPIHVVIFKWLKDTPAALYQKVLVKFQERRERRERNKNDIEKARSLSTSASRSTEMSTFTQTYSPIEKPKPVWKLKQHNEVWWKEDQRDQKEVFYDYIRSAREKMAAEK